MYMCYAIGELVSAMLCSLPGPRNIQTIYSENVLYLMRLITIFTSAKLEGFLKLGF